MDDEIKQFILERDAALLSLNRDRIQKYMRKYNIPIPPNTEVFWTAVHKARTGARNLPLPERQKSVEWLKSRGYSHFADGIS